MAAFGGKASRSGHPHPISSSSPLTFAADVNWGMPSWEVALGCAGKRKKVDRADIPSSRPRGLTPEDMTTCHLFSGCEIPIPLEEAAASAAPTREGSFGTLRNSVPEAPLFSATSRQTDLPVCEVAEPAPRTATCYACCAPITGTVYMGFDRAFCSATACHKGLAIGSTLPIRVRVLWLLGIGPHHAICDQLYLGAFFATRR